MSEKALSATATCEHQAKKSFDVLASVRLYQYDLETLGSVLPETKQRVYDEELSYIAEGINRPLYTEFVLQEREGQLAYFHEGHWRSYIGSLADNLSLAQLEAAADPRRQFMAGRAAEDLRVGYQIAALQPGEKLVFKSEFPQVECDLYGEEFIGEELGFQPARQMGFLYQAEKTLDGQTVLRSQTVDGNDADAYAAAMECGQNGGSIADMRETYDLVMGAKYRGKFYAGRPADESIPEENAWSVILRHKSLVEDYYLAKVEELAASDLPERELERAKKRLTYGVWARLKEILEEEALPGAQINRGYADGSLSLGSQVESAYQAAAARGEVLFGCGGAITGEKAILEAPAKDVFNLIFGNEKRWFSCPYCGAKQYGDPCASHLYCPTCTAEVKNGEVISTGRGRKSIIDFFIEEMEAWNRKYEQEKALKQAREQIKNT